MHGYLLGTAGGDKKMTKTVSALKELTIWSELGLFTSNYNIKYNLKVI